MKTIAITLMAAAFALVAGSSAYSAMLTDVSAIDSNHLAVVSISEVSSPIVASSSGDKVAFDSNGVWLAADYSKVSSGEHSMASSMKGSEHSSGLYCFDSLSRFCAAAY